MLTSAAWLPYSPYACLTLVGLVWWMNGLYGYWTIQKETSNSWNFESISTIALLKFSNMILISALLYTVLFCVWKFFDFLTDWIFTFCLSVVFPPGTVLVPRFEVQKICSLILVCSLNLNALLVRWCSVVLLTSCNFFIGSIERLDAGDICWKTLVLGFYQVGTLCSG